MQRRLCNGESVAASEKSGDCEDASGLIIQIKAAGVEHGWSPGSEFHRRSSGCFLLSYFLAICQGAVGRLCPSRAGHRNIWRWSAARRTSDSRELPAYGEANAPGDHSRL